MNKSNRLEEMLDQQLADYSDLLLKGEIPAEADMSGQNEPIVELKETVFQVERVAKNLQPSNEMSDRIRTRLSSEWLKEQKKTEEEKKASDDKGEGLFSSFRDWINSGFAPGRGLAFAATLVVILLAVVFLLPPDGPSLAATATETKSGIIIVLLITVMAGIGFAAFWFGRRKS